MKMADAHASPNYWLVWLYLFILTVVEIGVVYLPVAKLVIVILLIGLACYKALLVALYFMHLKFERRTLGIIALTPFVLCVFLILMLIPDIA
jgi:cytochrome c oxidase subunit 4